MFSTNSLWQSLQMNVSIWKSRLNRPLNLLNNFLNKLFPACCKLCSNPCRATIDRGWMWCIHQDQTLYMVWRQWGKIRAENIQLNEGQTMLLNNHEGYGWCLEVDDGDRWIIIDEGSRPLDISPETLGWIKTMVLFQ